MTRSRRDYEPTQQPKYQDLSQELDRLIAKHGLESVLKQVIDIDKATKTAAQAGTKGRGRKRGRPSTVLEDMHLADWIYEVAEDYRETMPNPVERAEIDLYQMVLDESEQKDCPFTKWQKSIKEKRLRGLRAWRILAEQVLNPNAAKLVSTLPTWLERFK